jgi:lauroyl/myristoyl acyltransferase
MVPANLLQYGRREAATAQGAASAAAGRDPRGRTPGGGTRGGQGSHPVLRGFPVTHIGRWDHKYDYDYRVNYGVRVGVSAAERRFWEAVYAKPVLRYRQRPNIEPWPGRPQVAMQAAAALRANEVVSISIDAPPLDNERSRAVEVPFLGRQAQLLPGVVTLAELTGAPVLIGFLRRGVDYRHQVWEISAPMPLDGGTAAAFGRCVAEVSAAISRSPAHWNFWHTVDLARLGLIDPQQDS